MQFWPLSHTEVIDTSSTSLSEPSLPSRELSMNPSNPALLSESFDCRLCCGKGRCFMLKWDRNWLECYIFLQWRTCGCIICSVSGVWRPRRKPSAFSVLCWLSRVSALIETTHSECCFIHLRSVFGFKCQSSLMSENTGPADSRECTALTDCRASLRLWFLCSDLLFFTLLLFIHNGPQPSVILLSHQITSPFTARGAGGQWLV